MRSKIPNTERRKKLNPRTASSVSPSIDPVSREGQGDPASTGSGAGSELLFWLWGPGARGAASGEHDPSAPSPGAPASAGPAVSGRRRAPGGPGRGGPLLAVPWASSRREPRSGGRSAEPGRAEASPRRPGPPERGPRPRGAQRAGAARRAGLGARAALASPPQPGLRAAGRAPRLLPSRRRGIPGDGPPGVAPPPGASPAQERQARRQA